MERKEKRSKKELAVDAVTKYLESEGYKVLKASVSVDGIKQPDPIQQPYGHTFTIKFDGAKV